MDEIKALINHKRHRLIINISDLHNFHDLGNRLALLGTNFLIILLYLHFFWIWFCVWSYCLQLVFYFVFLSRNWNFCRIIRTPSEYIQPLCDAVTDATRGIDPKYLKEGEQVHVGFEGPFVSRRVTPRELLSEFIGSMVCVEGIVTKCKTTFASFYIFLSLFILS